MSREIKFRAWSTFHNKKELIYLKESTLKDLKSCDNWKVMQWTGLKDKNGKEIYIGDLVKFINPMPIKTKEEVVEVKFVLEDAFLPYIYPFVNISSYNYKTKHFEGFGVNSKDCEVVGNIYEHPELLREGE